MNFNSLSFLIYLPVVVLVHYLLPHKFRWVWLLIASYYFYMSWNPYLVFLLLGTTLASYLAGIGMEKTENPKLKKAIMIGTVVLCLGLLAFFKYFNFLTQSVIDFLNLFSLHISSFSLDIILPIGISFYTFQTLSYVIDVYRGTYEPEKHFGYYALFVSFFPQLVAGPIERPGDLIPQLKKERKFDADNLFIGLRIAICGFFYKVCIADVTGVVVNAIFGSLDNAAWWMILLGGALFCFQMYGDFNGYSEIAVGSAKMLGIDLQHNFNRPYVSLTYGEFFRRWHISLNKWFTDYLYIPLGGSRKGKARRILNVFIVFGLCGLWHGANWTYLFWGLYAALWLTLETLLGKPLTNLFKKIGIDVASTPMKCVRHVLIFLVFIPAAIMFRSLDMNQMILAFSRIGSLQGAMPHIDAIIYVFIPVAILFGEVLITYSRQKYPEGGPSMKQLISYSLADALIIVVITLVWIFALSDGASSSFAYFQF